MVGISANGQRDANQHITMDGVVAVDPIHSAMLYVPSIEAVEESKVQSGVYSAKYGMNSGAQVNLAIKSGTNRLHSTLFEFIRNSLFDARGFFLAPTQNKNELRRYQFGAVASGPAARNRTFWLFSWESSRERRATPASAAVPTMAMRSGDFSELLQPRNRWYPSDSTPRTMSYPGSGTPFPNNIIPPSLLNPVSLNLLSWNKSTPLPEGGFLRQPNYDARASALHSSLNLVGVDSQQIDTNQYLARFDHNFNDRHRLFARYIIVPAFWNRVPLAIVSQQKSDYRSQNLGLGYTWIITPTIPDPGLGAIQARRPYPFYIYSRTPGQFLALSTIRLLQTDVDSSYNAMQLRAQHRYAKGLTLDASFNYQKAMGIGYEINSGGGFGPQTTQNPRNRAADWGRSVIDQRFRFVLSHVWEIPLMRNSTGLRQVLLAGWELNGIVTLASGLPVTVTQTGDSQNTGNAGSAERPNIIDGQVVSRVMDSRSLDQWFNTAAFVRSECDGCPGDGIFLGPKGYGNAGVALFDAPGQKPWGFGIFKSFKIREGHQLRFRWEAFNALNTPQFSAPSASLGNSTFSKITATIANNRKMQFGLKYQF